MRPASRFFVTMAVPRSPCAQPAGHRTTAQSFPLRRRRLFPAHSAAASGGRSRARPNALSHHDLQALQSHRVARTHRARATASGPRGAAARLGRARAARRRGSGARCPRRRRAALPRPCDARWRPCARKPTLRCSRPSRRRWWMRSARRRTRPPRARCSTPTTAPMRFARKSRAGRRTRSGAGRRSRPSAARVCWSRSRSLPGMPRPAWRRPNACTHPRTCASSPTRHATRITVSPVSPGSEPTRSTIARTRRPRPTRSSRNSKRLRSGPARSSPR